MPQLAELNDKLKRAKNGKKPHEPPPAAPAPAPVNQVSVDMAPVGEALASLKDVLAGLGQGGGFGEKEVKDAVKALLKGLAPLLKPADMNVEAIVKAIEAIPAPQFEMVVPEGEAVPYTFNIQRDNQGLIRRVIATPGALEEKKPDVVDIE